MKSPVEKLGQEYKIGTLMCDFEAPRLHLLATHVGSHFRVQGKPKETQESKAWRDQGSQVRGMPVCLLLVLQPEGTKIFFRGKFGISAVAVLPGNVAHQMYLCLRPIYLIQHKIMSVMSATGRSIVQYSALCFTKNMASASVLLPLLAIFWPSANANGLHTITVSLIPKHILI